ncbi:MAG TPA: putative glycoside hydrolase [Terriglobales bacterium]|nr:putative glycoside hydrolase [Terriglobales bacterium]
MSKAATQAAGADTGSNAASATTAVPSALPANTISITVEKIEPVNGIAHRYLSQSSLMLASELESQIREANQLPAKQLYVKKGQTLLIPNIEAQPVVEHPVPLPRDGEVRAIYLTGSMAGSARGLGIIKHWHEVDGNAVVFDIKDSDGSLSIPFDHPLAPHNRRAIPNLPKFVRYLHSMNLHAIARIALFRDEHIARDHSELAVQSRSTNQPWRENGKLVWTDTSNPKVQEYNIALAKWVAKSGADEIQFDYVRFPAEGNQADAKFHFQSAHPDWKRSDVIADFLDRAYQELHPEGVLVSLDVFGIMAWQRNVDLAHTGQDIVRMAKYCDVLSPMIYPSHFFGMDGYTKPGDAPEHFIGTSMERFETITAGSGVVLRPWLQAFAWRTKTYSPDYIMRQVSTSRDRGGIGFLFWNARNDYSKPYLAMPTMKEHADKYFGKRPPIEVTPAVETASVKKFHGKATVRLAKAKQVPPTAIAK